METRILPLAAVATAALLAACRPETETAVPEARPVRTVTVAKREVGEVLTFTGRIEAENETRLSFRIGGRKGGGAAQIGQHVSSREVWARAAPHDAPTT